MAPPEIFDAQEKVSNGEMTGEELREVEDEAIATTIPKLEATCSESITNGGYRRAWFHLDLLEQLGCVTVTGMMASSSGSEGRVIESVSVP